MGENEEKIMQEFLGSVSQKYTIPQELYSKFNVKRGLRNSDGTGVLVGLTNIGDVHGYVVSDNEKIPDDGRLTYRGYRLTDIVKGCYDEQRFGYEEVCYLILFGQLPTKTQLARFNDLLGVLRPLPEGFVETMTLRVPSENLMNKLARAVLVSFSFDKNPDDTSIENVLRQSIELIARIPAMAAYAYQSKAHYLDGKSLYIHSPQPGLSSAENLLYMMRPDNQYTKEEAELLDLSLMIHAEHGGGNNSAFTTHVVSSTGTDTYSAIAAAICSLKGPKHGGANAEVLAMIDNIKEHVKDWNDKEELGAYLAKIIRKEAHNRSGLIYGMGHAVYTLSDPRAVLLKEKARSLAKTKGFEKELQLYENVEELTPGIFNKERGLDKPMCANVDMYSGFVYQMLNIPSEMYTPLFTISRLVGWCAHRMEEIVSSKKIIRPAYKSVYRKKRYVPLEKRNGTK